MDATTRHINGITLSLCEIHLKKQREYRKGEWVVEAIYKDFREENQGIVATYHLTLKKALRYIRGGAEYL